MILRAENRNVRLKIYTSASWYTTNPTWIGRGLNPNRCERPPLVFGEMEHILPQSLIETKVVFPIVPPIPL